MNLTLGKKTKRYIGLIVCTWSSTY